MSSVKKKNSSAFHLNLNDFRRNRKYCDVHIWVQNCCFQCHRVVLAAASKYFDAMYGGSFGETNTVETVLYEQDADTFEEILKYMYTREEPTVTVENVFNLLTASAFFQTIEIEDCCVDFIVENISLMQDDVSLCLRTYMFACGSNNVRLRNFLQNYILKNFASISRSDTFLEIPFNDMKTLLEQYQSNAHVWDLIPFRDENMLMDAIIRWMYCSFDEREKYFANLIEFVDLKRISTEYAEFMLEGYKISFNLPIEVKRNSEYLTFNRDKFKCTAIDFDEDKALTPYRNFEFFNNKTLHLYVTMYGNSLIEESNSTVISINKYKPDWFVSCQTNKLPNFAHMRSAVMDEFEPLHYCLEMDDNVQKFRAYSSYDLNSISRALAPCPVTRRFFEMCGGPNNSIYVYDIYHFEGNSHHVAGFTSEEILRGIYCYKCELDRWFPVPPLKKNVTGAAITADEKLVYLIGDKNHAQAHDHRAGDWMELPRTNHEHYCSKICMLNGKIYVASKHSIEAFDTVARKWEIVNRTGLKKDALTPLFVNLRTMASYENKLWVIESQVIGGSKSSYEHNTINLVVYDPITQEWCGSSSLNDFIWSHHRATSKDWCNNSCRALLFNKVIL